MSAAASGEKHFEDLAIGDSAERAFVITREMVHQFATFTGDDNPSHQDERYAKRIGLDAPSVHGMLYVSLMSGILGSQLPGHASMYLSQSIRFGREVHVGDTLIARVSVTGLDPSTGIITLRTECLVDGKTAMEGEAKMVLPRRG